MILIDRLINDNVVFEGHSEEVLRENIRKNIENILNTKKCFLSFESCYKQLSQSVINYGIDDFSSLWIDSLEACEGLCRQMEITIQVFEPRLNHVVVSLEETSHLINRTLKLKISGTLHENMGIERLNYHSTVSSLSHYVELKGFYHGEKFNV